jgi:2-iminobutanoate/2-iminopropanoate deaminase
VAAVKALALLMVLAASAAAAQPAAPRPPVPLSPAVAAGGLLFVSGQLAIGPGNKLVGDDIATQTGVTLDNVAAILARHGLTLADVVNVTVHLTRAEDFRAFNAAYVARMTPPYPTRTTVIAGMVLPGALVEITVVARLKQP